MISRRKGAPSSRASGQAKWYAAERGATAIEYALMAAAIIAVVTVVVVAMGVTVQGMFDAACNALHSVGMGPGCP